MLKSSWQRKSHWECHRLEGLCRTSPYGHCRGDHSATHNSGDDGAFSMRPSENNYRNVLFSSRRRYVPPSPYPHLCPSPYPSPHPLIPPHLCPSLYPCIPLSLSLAMSLPPLIPIYIRPGIHTHSLAIIFSCLLSFRLPEQEMGGAHPR